MMVLGLALWLVLGQSLDDMTAAYIASNRVIDEHGVLSKMEGEERLVVEIAYERERDGPQG